MGSIVHALILQAEAGDAIPTDYLRALHAMDQAIAADPTMETLLSTAARLIGRPVAAIDLLNNRHMMAMPDGVVTEPLSEHAHRILAEAAHTPSADHLDDSCFVRLTDARGVLGAVWLEPIDDVWDAMALPTVERLSFGLILSFRGTNDAERAAFRYDPAALETLVSARLPVEDLAYHCRRAGLREAGPYTCLAAMSVVPHPASPEAVARVVTRALGNTMRLRGSTTIGRAALIVVDGHASAKTSWNLDSPEIDALDIRLGIGSSVPAARLRDSWRSAQTSLRLSIADPDLGRAVPAQDLGAWTLLDDVPAQRLAEIHDVQVLLELEAASTRVPDDLQAIKVVCESASLRQAAARLHIHHSTLEYRLRVLEDRLGLGSWTPALRLRLLLAIRLILASRVRLDQTSASLNDPFGTNRSPSAVR